MDPGRPKQPTGVGVLPGIPALESVVRAHSDQLIKLNTELSSAFAQVTGEMGDLRNSATATSTSLSSLSNQVTMLTDLVTRLLPVHTGRSTEPAPQATPPSAPAPLTPPDQSLDPRWEPTLSAPNVFARGFDLCRGYLGQCELLFCHQPSRFRMDGARVALIMSTLTGRALDWAVAVVRQNPQLSSNLAEFLEEFSRVFDHPTQGSDAAGRLHTLCQGTRDVADYTLEFRTLAEDSGWDNGALRSAYRRGLSKELKDLLVRDQPTSLNDLTTLAHRLDDRLRERRLERVQRREGPSRYPPTHLGSNPHRYVRSPTNPASLSSGTDQSRASEGEEPMQLGWSRLTPSVREHRFRERLCLYCGGGGAHHTNPTKRPGSLERGVLVSRANISPHPAKPNSLFPVSLSWGLETLSVGALVDSGADECLMDVTLARQVGVPLEPMDTTLSAQVLDGHNLGNISHRTIPISLTISGNHSEIIRFFIIHCTPGIRTAVVKSAQPSDLLVHGSDFGLERDVPCHLPSLRPLSVPWDVLTTVSSRSHGRSPGLS